jgi:circadian clock protein KaiC
MSYASPVAELSPAGEPLATAATQLAKAPTGVDGLDEVLAGGLPRGRPTLICGGAGCGKTLLGVSFLVHGALKYGEPGAFIAFEERPEDLAANVMSLGVDLDALEGQGLISIDHVHIDPDEIVESGAYDLEGLFVRLGLAIDSVGAKRIVIDTLETLFGGLSNYGVIRSELRRLFAWLKERGVTAVITAERGDGRLTRHGLEEYVSDCVIVLDQRVDDQVSTRRLRVVKYRGSTHGTNEYPFLIGGDGISVLPVTGARLDHKVFEGHVSSGIPRLDTMLDGKGYYRGSSVLVSGTAGAGKSSIAAHFAEATAGRGERVLYLSFEESPAQITRNMRSIGIDLGKWAADGRLRFLSSRPTAFGLETHLAVVHKAVSEFKPAVAIIDPISNFLGVSYGREAHEMLVRLVDYLKSNGITALFTSLTAGGAAVESTETAISSVVDTWILVKSIEHNGERTRGLYVLKARGMSHSNQVREFVMTDRGVDLIDVYVGAEGVLTGTARAAQEAREKADQLARSAEIEEKKRLLARRRAQHREQIAKLETELAADVFELERAIAGRESDEARRLDERSAMARLRQADREKS